MLHVLCAVWAKARQVALPSALPAARCSALLPVSQCLTLVMLPSAGLLSRLLLLSGILGQVF